MNMESNVVFILRCILAVTFVAVHSFNFRDMDGTVYQSMKYNYPWLSPVNLDSYIEKRHYTEEFILKKPYLFDNNQELLASIMQEAQSSLPKYRGLVLLLNEWTKPFWKQAYYIPDKLKLINMEWTKTFWKEAYHIPDKSKFINMEWTKSFRKEAYHIPHKSKFINMDLKEKFREEVYDIPHKSKIIIMECIKTFWEQAYHIRVKLIFTNMVLLTILTVWRTIIAERIKKWTKTFWEQAYHILDKLKFINMDLKEKFREEVYHIPHKSKIIIMEWTKTFWEQAYHILDKLKFINMEWTKTFWKEAYHIPDKSKFINMEMVRIFQLDPIGCTSFVTIYNKEKDINPPDDIVELQTYISKTLFEHHSNLNIINSGNLQPSDTGHKSSITLYCDKKGLIPRNEAKFPKVLEINDKWIQISIKEGDFKLCPGFRTTKSEWNNPLRMGACIGVQGIMSSATMGPFIDLPDGSLGFLTCAHLFHNVSVGAIIMQPSQLAFAGFDIMESDKVCGVLVHKVFEPQRIVSVDVAVVKITSRIPNRGMFAIGSNEEILKAGFDAPPVFDSGSIKEHISPTDANRPIVKFGSETGLTKGAFTLNGSHVKISDQIGFEAPCGNQTLTMHNQYEIQQIGNIPFFRPGDSGSGVFILDDHKELHCVGMAIGCTSYGSAIVTPVGAIFEALGLPKKLKTFYHESMEE